MPTLNEVRSYPKIDDFYLHLQLIPGEKDMLIRFLEENRMIYDEQPSAWWCYLEEEAECMLENCLYDLFDEWKLRDAVFNHKRQLAERFNECDSYDQETYWEITNDYCYDNIEEYRKDIDGE